MTYDLVALKREQRLEDVAARYVQLHRSGARLIGLCPLHEERTPSFTIDPRRQQFRCFGCHAHGDVIDLIRQLERLDFKGAVTRLGGEPDAQVPRHAGVRPSDDRSIRPSSPNPASLHSAVMTQALTMALEWWQEALWRTPRALAYLEARGLDRATIAQSGIGYADGRVLLPLRWLRGGLDAAYTLGIIDRYGHDRFSGRIIVPELRNGRPIWLTGRLLPAHEGENRPCKYLTLTGIERPLLGYEAACAARCPQGGGVLVCEGPFDRLAAARWGYTAVALGGAWASPWARRELRILLVDKQGGYMVPDRDRPGHSGMLTMLVTLDLPHAARPGVVRLPLMTKDLGELATHPQGERLLRERLAAARQARQRALPS